MTLWKDASKGWIKTRKLNILIIKEEEFWSIINIIKSDIIKYMLALVLKKTQQLAIHNPDKFYFDKSQMIKYEVKHVCQ